MRFGLKDVTELPSMEEFEKLVAEAFQSDLLPVESEAEAAGTADIAVAEPAEQQQNAAQTDEDHALVTADRSPGENDPAA